MIVSSSHQEFAGWISEKSHIVELVQEDDDAALTREVERRSVVRRRRQEQNNRKHNRNSPQIKVSMTIKAQMAVSSKRFFLLNKKQSSAGIVLSEDLLTATCDTNVQASENMFMGGGRGMVMATRGFSRGVHYWEVQVNSAQWGSVFIGVAPKVMDLRNSWSLLHSTDASFHRTQVIGADMAF